MTKLSFPETDLYLPIKRFLEDQGYDVKGEVAAADVVAVRDGEDPVIVELKKGFSLSLFHQAITRQKISDTVYIAVPRAPGRPFAKALRDNRKLCRLLGLGLLLVRIDDERVEPILDPGPYHPRKSNTGKNRLLKEFFARKGDPNIGGSRRKPLMTAYRQDALRCLRLVSEAGPLKASEVAKRARVGKARRIMADNHYGWFHRVERGIYGLSASGIEALSVYRCELDNL